MHSPILISSFTCDSGDCTISDSYVNDDWCDCPDCSDEAYYDCDRCGGCPDECGDFVLCENDPFLTSIAPVLEEQLI